MTNIPLFNRPAFFEAAKYLEFAGHIPLNPAVLPEGLSQQEYMNICMPMVSCADAIYLLDGWRQSPGANAGYALAYKLEKKVLIQHDSVL